MITDWAQFILVAFCLVALPLKGSAASNLEDAQDTIEAILSKNDSNKTTKASLNGCILEIVTDYHKPCIERSEFSAKRVTEVIELETVHRVTATSPDWTTFIRFWPERPSVLNFFTQSTVRSDTYILYCSGEEHSSSSGDSPNIHIPGKVFDIPGVTEDSRFEGLTCKKVAIQVTA